MSIADHEIPRNLFDLNDSKFITITSADLEIDQQAKYACISIVDKNGKFANTRGYFMEEISG